MAAHDEEMRARFAKYPTFSSFMKQESSPIPKAPATPKAPTALSMDITRTLSQSPTPPFGQRASPKQQTEAATSQQAPKTITVVNVILGENILRWDSHNKYNLSDLKVFVAKSYNLNIFDLRYEDDDGDIMTMLVDADLYDAMTMVAEADDCKALQIYVHPLSKSTHPHRYVINMPRPIPTPDPHAYLDYNSDEAGDTNGITPIHTGFAARPKMQPTTMSELELANHQARIQTAAIPKRNDVPTAVDAPHDVLSAIDSDMEEPPKQAPLPHDNKAMVLFSNICLYSGFMCEVMIVIPIIFISTLFIQLYCSLNHILRYFNAFIGDTEKENISKYACAHSRFANSNATTPTQPTVVADEFSQSGSRWNDRVNVIRGLGHCVVLWFAISLSMLQADIYPTFITSYRAPAPAFACVVQINRLDSKESDTLDERACALIKRDELWLWWDPGPSYFDRITECKDKMNYHSDDGYSRHESPLRVDKWPFREDKWDPGPPDHAQSLPAPNCVDGCASASCVYKDTRVIKVLIMILTAVVLLCFSFQMNYAANCVLITDILYRNISNADWYSGNASLFGVDKWDPGPHCVEVYEAAIPDVMNASHHINLCIFSYYECSVAYLKMDMCAVISLNFQKAPCSNNEYNTALFGGIHSIRTSEQMINIRYLETYPVSIIASIIWRRIVS